VLVALAGAVYGFTHPDPFDAPGWVTAVTAALLIMPLSAAFACDRGWPRWLMLAYAGGMAVLGVVSVGMIVHGLDLAEGNIRGGLWYFKEGFALFRLNTWAALLSGFVGNWLMTRTPRL
jgi:hypothetical protein